MKPLRLFSFLVFAFVVSLTVPSYLFANSSYQSDSDVKMLTVKTLIDGGIKEDIAPKYRVRYDRWKTEFLDTEFGRTQWDKYASNRQFLLTITISNKKGKGAGTDKYLWDEAGNFVGATITLGDELNEGYPNPIYYPVMNSLSANETSYSISGKILAAAKISHEFGHVNQTANANRAFMQMQNTLMPVYTSIFLKNGRNTRDKKLVDLAQQMGGTPVEIWESREYWSEVNALRYLNERLSKEEYQCFVFNKIKQNIITYAKEYENRFDNQTEFSRSPCWK
ncbi:MAG TPA: hypothetical protein PLP21_07575 [Pyrinomonadaceae bacterium]|nr:hypothetical protein [Acidobacteriota bacterium]HQZ96164.1 hypothetical protein [Pyrinomonadaceae bacterium]